MDGNTVNRIGWVASVMTILMFSSYIDQIRLNVSGHPGSLVLPVMTMFNSVSWISYAVLKEKTEWPILICNLFGVVLGFLTFITGMVG